MENKKKKASLEIAVIKFLQNEKGVTAEETPNILKNAAQRAIMLNNNAKRSMSLTPQDIMNQVVAEAIDDTVSKMIQLAQSTHPKPT